MKHLQKLLISNGRRFGNDIKFDIGPGATIIVAPNGTGKTTIFQAIEFAVTGEIQKLGKPPLPFIRDKQTDVSIRLEFDDGKYCEVKYHKDYDPIITGDHGLLFNGQDLNAIPYLLRLTHLLAQVGGDQWFVQKSKDDAGDLLNWLSIGKELNQVNSVMTSAKRSAHKFQENAKVKFDAAQEALNKFNELREKRKSVTQNFILRPLNEILAQLNVLYESAGGSTQETKETLSAIRGFAGQIQGKLESLVREHTQRNVMLAKFDSLIIEYVSNNKELSSKKEVHVKLQKKKDDFENELKGKKELFQKISEQISKIKLEIKELTDKKNLFDLIQTENARRTELEKALIEKQKSLKKFQDKHNQDVEAIEKANSLHALHSSFRKQAEELSAIRGKVSTSEELLNQWENHNTIISDLENITIPKLADKRKSIESTLNDIQSALENAEREYKATLSAFNSLQDASDAIQGAVGIIESNLPKDKGDCPVCGEVYGPAELRNRISKALSAIDPRLTQAIADKKQATEKYEASRIKVDEQKAILDQINQELMNATLRYGELRSIINEQIRPKFPECETIQDALRWLSTQKETLKTNQHQLDKKTKNTPDEPSSEQLSTLEFNKVDGERKISDIRGSIQISEIELKEIDEKLRIANQQIDGADSEVIKTAIKKKEESLSLHQSELEKEQQQQEERQKQLAEVVDHSDVNSRNISKIVGRQSEIKKEWSEAKLQGEPTVQTLLKEKELLAQKLELLDTSKVTLNKIIEDLARWQMAEEYQKYDSEIKNTCGKQSEEEYLDDLEKNVENSNRQFQSIVKKTETLESLHSNVNDALNSIHEYLQSANPLWKALLRRVVVDPRIAEALLDSSTFYNKPQAEVKIPLNGQYVKATNIASEAQITDLQLTFMLTMATTYKWTPWRALLLDDPTQHHDLVHAAAVFDLLRDYISTYDFQILLATHDKVQARFFMRKLQNDGIPVRQWTLKPTDRGVIAEKVE